MKFPILASVLILCAVIAYSSHRSKTKQAEEEEKFWQREREANNTRRKSLDGLKYIKIPLESLPINCHKEIARICECIETIISLSESPIVNLTGYSNTDLKLEYGAPNITLLSAYDQRYTTLARTLEQWAEELIKIDDKEAALTVLEFAISTGTDVSASYRNLADIYHEKNNISAIEGLIPIAESISSPMKDSILTYLRSCLPQ